MKNVVDNAENNNPKFLSYDEFYKQIKSTYAFNNLAMTFEGVKRLDNLITLVYEEVINDTDLKEEGLKIIIDFFHGYKKAQKYGISNLQYPDLAKAIQWAIKDMFYKQKEGFPALKNAINRILKISENKES